MIDKILLEWNFYILIYQNLVLTYYLIKKTIIDNYLQ